MTVKILTGDCRDVMRSLLEKSVHCVVTSPPYWGLRDYQIPPSIWGGDADCEHDWGEEIAINATNHTTKARWNHTRNGRDELQPTEKRVGRIQTKVKQGQFCKKCNAWEGAFGLEPTHHMFVEHIVEVFSEIWRVLRDDGVVYFNMGDGFCSGGRSTWRSGASGNKGQNVLDNMPRPRQPPDLKPKDLLGMPWRCAFALQEFGWFLRSEIIWAKPNPMPESVTDRPTKSHEQVFLLAKSGDNLFWTHRDGLGTRMAPEPDYRWVNRESGEETEVPPDGWPSAGKDVWRRVNLWVGSDYFYDSEAVREESITNDMRRPYAPGQVDKRGNGHDRRASNPLRGVPPRHAQYKSSDQSGLDYVGRGMGRNLRSVWTIATQPFPEGHFAVFPDKLAETCILAGTSEKGCCTCGAPWARTITKGEPDEAHRSACGADAAGGYNGRSTKKHDAAGVQNSSDIKRRILEGLRKKTYGWQPTCDCPPTDPVPCVVLDPFGGAGTTALVADRLGRDAILIELNADYAAMAKRRVIKDSPLFARVAAE
jgi:DNA modification methylase